MPNFNIPDPNDPEFNSKIATLLDELFNSTESQILNLPAIDEPEDGLQVGSVFFDKSTGKLKVNTEQGIKAITFDP